MDDCDPKCYGNHWHCHACRHCGVRDRCKAHTDRLDWIRRHSAGEAGPRVHVPSWAELAKRHPPSTTPDTTDTPDTSC